LGFWAKRLWAAAFATLGVRQVIKDRRCLCGLKQQQQFIVAAACADGVTRSQKMLLQILNEGRRIASADFPARAFY